MKESMRVVTESGVVEITLCADHEDNMKNLREELFGWYEDFVRREMSEGRVVTTTNSPVWEYAVKSALNSIYGKKCIHPDVLSADIESGIEHVMKLRNLLDSYIVLRSLDSRCGEVVQIPIRHEQYVDIIWKAYSYIDHVLKRYMDADESRFPDEYPF